MDEEDSPFTAQDARAIAESAYHEAMQAIICEHHDADFSVHTGIDGPTVISTPGEASLMSEHSASSRAALAAATTLIPTALAPLNVSPNASPTPQRDSSPATVPANRSQSTSSPRNAQPSPLTPPPPPWPPQHPHQPPCQPPSQPPRQLPPPDSTQTMPSAAAAAAAAAAVAAPKPKLLPPDQAAGQCVRSSNDDGQERTAQSGAPNGTTAQTASTNVTAQERAWWSCEEFSSLAATPHEDDPRLLSRFNLEAKLLEQVYSEQPSRLSLDVTECMVREVVNSVVKNIVGIVECLMDRILMDQKQDVLRTLVGELMTQETHQTVNSGLQLLRNYEMQEVDKTIVYARQEMQALKDQCEGLKQQMEDSEDRLGKLLTSTRAEEHQGWMDRLGAVEQEFVSRREFDEKLNASIQETFDLRHHIHSFTNTWGGLRSTQAQDLADLRQHCETNLATKAGVSEMKENLTAWVTELKEGTQLQWQEAHDVLQSTANKHIERLDSAVRANVERIDKDLNDLKNLKGKVTHALKNVEESRAALAAFKEEAAADFSQLREGQVASMLSLSDAIAALEAKMVTKADLAEVKHLEEESLAKLGEGQAGNERELQELRNRLQAKCEDDNVRFATNQTVDKVILAAEHRLEASIRLNKESLDQLWSEFGREQERSRDWENYQSTLKNNLNHLVEAFHTLDKRNREMGRENNRTSDRVDRLLQQQAESKIEKELSSLTKAHSETVRRVAGLETQVLQGFFDNRNEQEDLRNYSSMKLMDQIDKALTLHGRQTRLESDYHVLSNAVKFSSGDPPPEALREMLWTPSTGPPPSPFPDDPMLGYASTPTPPVEGLGGRPGRPQSAVRRTGPPRPHTAGPTPSASAGAPAASCVSAAATAAVPCDAARLPSLP
mmetsp:Transcript_65918/g.142937  ORF Transcript_65918/g.142937 Transcript_65918/m.142937 type:complete len:894 (+) Transcript_65918:72-2753(+)